MTISKQDMAFNALKRGTWVKSAKLREKLGDNDLRSVRRLRELGYTVESRKRGDSYEYRMGI